MRLIFTILLLKSFAVNARLLYVSNAGNDSNDGLTTSTSWRTLSKVFTSSVSGDSVLLNRGDTWNERLVLVTGTFLQPIYVGAYGSGTKPLITGFQTLSSPSVAGNIYTYTFSNSVLYQNTVTINGVMYAKGRYPNYGYLTFTSHSGNSQITGALTGTPNYTGGEVVIRTNHYTIDKGFISSQSTGTINFYPATYYAPTNNNGYFIQNIASVLDTLNEWCYDSATKVIKVYANSTPVVRASSLDTLVKLYGKKYITFENLKLSGANQTAFGVDSTDYITIKNCDIDSSGTNGISGKKSTHLTVTNNTVKNSWNDGIIFLDFLTALADSHYATVSGNTVANTGTAAGMNKTGFHTNVAVQIFGDHPTITNNTITNTGYIGVYWYGDTASVKYNYVDTVCYVKDDGGGLYTYSGLATPKSGGSVVSNFVKNGLTASAGTDAQLLTFGIYMDNETQRVLIDSNLVTNFARADVFVHESHYITVTNNTLYNSLSGLLISNTTDGHATAHVTFKNNIVIGQPIDRIFYALLHVVSVNFDAMDSNYYYNAADTAKIVRNNIYYTLKGWQDSTGFDLHSLRKPPGVTSTFPILISNATTAPISQPFTGTYIDSKYITRSAVQLLQPFRFNTLYKSTTNLLTGQKFGTFKFQ